MSWADALVAMADRALGGSPRAARDRHLVVMHLREGHAHLHLGPGLPDALRRYLACDAWVRPVLSRHGVATSVGRALRIVPTRTRLVVEERDRGCRVPGCGRHRRLEIHHVVPWSEGGPADTANLVALCPYHHRLYHRGLLGIAGNADDPGGLVFTDSQGRRLTGSGQPAPPPQLALGGNWTPPAGDRLDPRWVHFNEAVRNS